MGKRQPLPERLFYRIGEVAELAGVKPYVLRYWESEFPGISPQKSASGQRVYRRADVELILVIKHLLYGERYSIEGARRRLRELRREGALKDFKSEVLGGRPDETAALENAPIDPPPAKELLLNAAVDPVAAIPAGWEAVQEKLQRIRSELADWPQAPSAAARKKRLGAT